jgi:hypothetical protein
MFRVNGSKTKEWTYIYRAQSAAIGDSMEFAVIKWERASLLPLQDLYISPFRSSVPVAQMVTAMYDETNLTYDTVNPKSCSHTSDTGCKNLLKQ